MKKSLIILSLLLAVVCNVRAEWAHIGYSSSDQIDVNGGAFGEAGTYTVGALFSKSMLSSYKDCQIVGIRVAAAIDLGRTRNFIYDMSGDAPAVVREQTQRIYSGWNEILFNGDPYVITGEETLFFGFDYTETAEMITADQGGLCGVGNDTNGSFCLLRNNTLYPITGIGQLCVQLIIDVTSLPQYDLDVADFVYGFRYKTQGEKIEGYTIFRNVGKSPVTKYRWGFQIDNAEPTYYDVELESGKSIGVGATDFIDLGMSLPADIAVGRHEIRLFIDQVEGAPMAANSRNDERTAGILVYDKNNTVNREKAYLEIYTDQSSPYSSMLNDAIAVVQKQYPQMQVVNVHRPATSLAIDEAAYLHELYAYDHPTFTSNRSYFPGEPNIAYDMNDYLQYGTDISASIIGGIIAQDMAAVSFGTIALEKEYNADTRQLTVKATGSLSPDAEKLFGDLAMTLMVVENGVKAEQMVYNSMTGRTQLNQNYNHNSVLRGYMTAPTGDIISVAGNTYTFERTMTLNTAWNAENMSIVALLTKYADVVTPENLIDMDVINCNSINISNTSGIGNISLPQTLQKENKYNLQGQRVNDNFRGIVISGGKKMIRK